MAELKFEIKEHIGTVSESSKGWTKELNIVSWNGANPKFDLRDWAPEHEKMGKGLTFTNEELKNLRDILIDMNLKINAPLFSGVFICANCKLKCINNS